MHSLRAVPLLLLTVLAKAELPTPFHPVIDLNPSCPEVRHYYRRLPVSHTSGEGRDSGLQCHRCYCKETVNGSAACWPREDRRCDDVGRRRVRRGIIGLSDLLFGNAASKFLKEELPKECVPKSSFSEGCPPADWCVGCTVCDCDSKGRWDCHILSFCNGDEKKKRANGSKVPVPKSIRNLKNKPTKKTTKENKKSAITKRASKSKTRKSPQTTKKPNRQTKKIIRRKPKVQKKKQTKPRSKKVVVKKGKKVIYKPKPPTKRIKPTNKPKATRRTKPTKKPKPTKIKKIIKKTKRTQKPKTTKNFKRSSKNIKTPIKNKVAKTIEETTLKPNSKVKRSKTQIRKVVHRVLSKRESNPDLNEISDVMSGDSLEQTEVGRKIVKKVLTTLEKLMAKQLAMVHNKTNILRSQYQDCPKVKVIIKKKKKEKPKPKRKTKAQMTLEEIKQRKMEAYINRNSWRVKRDAVDIVELNSATQNNNKSKMNEVTNADVKFLVKELEKRSTAHDVDSIIINTTLSNVADNSETGTDIIKSNERTLTTTAITNSNTTQLFNTTEANLKYYEYLPDNTTRTSHTAEILANGNRSESETTEFKYQNDTLNKLFETTEFRSQNDSSNKLIDLTTQNILTEDHLNKSQLKQENNEKFKEFTIFNTKNILSNSIDTANEYTYNTSHTMTPNISKSMIGISSKIIADETKIIQLNTEKPQFKQRNKKYDDIHKRNKTKKVNNINIFYKSYNITTPNRMRLSNISINDADLIKLIKNKIKKRQEKKKVAYAFKNNTKKSMANVYIATSVGSSTNKNLSNNATNTNTIEEKGSLQKLLEKLIVQKKDPDTQSEKKPKYSVFKYLRNIFKKIFTHKKDNHTAHKTNEGYTLEVLCDNVGACFKNDHIKVALRTKLHDLNSETEKVFKTIKIIKSLLHLIDVPINVTDDSTEKMLNNDIKKLNAILKGSYYETNTLTAREKSQIRTVKENIHNFIVSVGKFASILNDVLDELYKDNKKYTCQRNLRLNKKHNSQKTLYKIKKLLINYNVVQNTFMKRIFQLIKNAENNTSSESPPKPINNENSLNDTPVIDTYTTNIIEHLRKLKNLAQAINSTRRKRWTSKNSDAMEFMLLMLEYLIKQNQPLEKHPANDGIDLLIEAIQNAPSIKSIKKKVLSYNYTKWDTIPTRSKDPRFILTVTQNPLITTSTTDSVDSEPVKRSNEDDIDGAISIKYDNSISRDENFLGDRATIDLDDEIIAKIYQRGDNKSFPIDFPDIPEENISNQNDTVEKVDLKSVSNIEVKIPGNDIVTSTEEENNFLVAGATVKVTDVPLEVRSETAVPWEDYKLDLVPLSNKETNLDWIEENFGTEINVYRSDELFTTMQPVSLQTVSTQETTTKATTTTVVPNKSNDDISGLTVEVEDEKKPKETDLILQRKEMELLNSLDYGTDSPDFDDSMSKDGSKSGESSFRAYSL